MVGAELKQLFFSTIKGYVCINKRPEGDKDD